VGQYREPDRIEVAGRLIDPNGDSIPLAIVQLKGESEAGEKLRLRTTTGPDGSFIFRNVPPGQYGTVVGSPPSEVVYDGEPFTVLPVAAPFSVFGPYLPLVTASRRIVGSPVLSSMIHGRLLSDSREPLAGVRVAARRRGAGARVSWIGLTDDDGSFYIDAVPPGTYAVWSTPHTGYRRSAAHLRLSPDSVCPVELVARTGSGRRPVPRLRCGERGYPGGWHTRPPVNSNQAPRSAGRSSANRDRP
jgi:hypothetical protein